MTPNIKDYETKYKDENNEIWITVLFDKNIINDFTPLGCENFL